MKRIRRANCGVITTVSETNGDNAVKKMPLWRFGPTGRSPWALGRDINNFSFNRRQKNRNPQKMWVPVGI